MIGASCCNKSVAGKKKISEYVYLGAVSGALVFSVVWILYFLKGYAPFGVNSLVSSDANIQYMDFFSYFKDVLSENNSIVYSQSNGLGSTGIGLYSYYLASPFNFLLIFFKKSQIPLFFSVIFSIKLVMISITTSIFLNYRFEKVKEKRRIVIILLSVSFALCQWNISRGGNIMWLDGVYMLPLMLMGIYRLVRGKGIFFLSVTVALSVFFNWYIAAINLVFAIFWFIFELCLAANDKALFRGGKGRFKNADKLVAVLKLTALFAASVVVGVLAASALFFPSVGAMGNGGKGSLDLGRLFDFSFSNDPFTVINGYVLGTRLNFAFAGIYAGSFAGIGCVCSIFVKQDKKKKVILLTMLIFSVCALYWNPLFNLFSLFRESMGHHIRHVYLTTFVVIFIAADFYLTVEKSIIKKMVICTGPAFSILALILNYIRYPEYVAGSWLFVLFAAVTSAGIYLALSNGKQLRRLGECLLLGGFIADMGVSVSMQMDIASLPENIPCNADIYAYYQKETERLVDDIKEYDSGIYRINQTSKREHAGSGKMYESSVFNNEGLAFNYLNIAQYTSTPNGKSVDFFDRCGYKAYQDALNVVDSSIVGIDSLCAVKYVMSEYPLSWGNKINVKGTDYGKEVYQNPYALPFAFTYTDKMSEDLNTENPFLYQNSIYEQLSGEKCSLYTKLDYEAYQADDGSLIYNIKLPEGNLLFYGNNLPGQSLNVNDKYTIDNYNQWLSVSVFEIMTQKGESQAKVVSKGEDIAPEPSGNEQFYALDLDKFKEVTDKIKEGEVKNLELDNGYVKMSCDGGIDKRVFISIPGDDSWDIFVNGKKVVPEFVGGCFYTIAVADGQTVVEMKYHVKYLKEGIVSEIIGVGIIAAGIILEKKYFKTKSVNK